MIRIGCLRIRCTTQLFLLLRVVRIDVKTTKYDGGKLLVDSRKGVKTLGVDYYALMTGQFPGPYTFRGFIAREHIIQPHKLGLLGGHKSYMAEQHELTDRDSRAGLILIDSRATSVSQSGYRP